MWKNLDEWSSFKKLQAVEKLELKKVLTAQRIKKFVVEAACDFVFLFGTKLVDEKILSIFQELADESCLIQKYKTLLSGEVVNLSEKRMVLHHLTRGQLAGDVYDGGVNKREFYKNELAKIKAFAADVHSGKITNAQGKKFTDVVQIGIGGSDLGPRACYLALKTWAKKRKKQKMEAHFISNVDPDDVFKVMDNLGARLETSLFILVSKSGTTQETLANEMLVKQYLKEMGLEPSQHIITVTSETSPLAKSATYKKAFFMDDHIGGRYSSTSVCGGVVLSLSLGFDTFEEFLAGAQACDNEALNEDILQNPALLDALMGVYETSCLGFPMTAVLPYSQGLSRFPAHLQQLDMESNGKSVNRFGKPVNYKTGPIVFGESGTNGQHSFYQSLHQGTHIVPLQFIGFAKSQAENDVQLDGSSSQTKLNANLIAQIIAFAKGKTDSNLNKNFAGERPSSLLFCKKELSPKALGYLLAFFENKIMFQGFLWNLNSFDQEGVQLGKVLTKEILSGNASNEAKAFIDICK
ncbi:MAG: glucose-6-phosphate isomerase [Treponemataceae bacterium]